MNLINAKVYYDGSHWIAVPHTERPFKPRRRRFISPNECETIEQFEKAFKKAPKAKRSKRMEKLMKEFKPLFETEEEAKEFVESHFNRLSRNNYERFKRMKRKAYLQIWSFFATFTYSDELQTEESFRKRLTYCLRHLATRKGWKFIGVWERGENGDRLHFHALAYVPPNSMVGEISEVEDYNFKTHKKRIIHQNSFFAKRFGRNDFIAIATQFDIEDRLKYMLKYITKSNEKVVYSRGLKSYLSADILDEDIVCPYGEEDDENKFILSDKFTCIAYGEILGKVCPEVIERMPKCN